MKRIAFLVAMIAVLTGVQAYRAATTIHTAPQPCPLLEPIYDPATGQFHLDCDM